VGPFQLLRYVIVVYLGIQSHQISIFNRLLVPFFKYFLKLLPVSFASSRFVSASSTCKVNQQPGKQALAELLITTYCNVVSPYSAQPVPRWKSSTRPILWVRKDRFCSFCVLAGHAINCSKWSKVCLQSGEVLTLWVPISKRVIALYKRPCP
jgi:hypothetical protein